jgi:hypothetical protein
MADLDGPDSTESAGFAAQNTIAKKTVIGK